MKNIKLKSLVAIAAALICVGCVDELKEVAPAYNPEITDGTVKSVEFVIPSFVEEDDNGIQTKTTLTSKGFVWAEKDTVGIFPSKGNQIYYEMSSGAGSSSAEFDGGGWALKDEHLYSSYYPLQGNFYLDRKTIPVTYDTEVTQVGNNNSDHLGANAFMFAPETKLSNGKVTFKFWQLGSVLKPRVTLPAGTYTKLVLSTDEPIFVVSGKYDLTTGVDASSSTATYPDFVPVIVPETGGLTNKLTINLEDVTFSAETELIAYIMAAPVDVSNIPITVTIYCGDSPKYRYEFMRTSSFVAQTNHNIRPNEKGLMSAANSSESANAAFAAGETSLSLVDVTENASLDLVLPETSEPVSIVMASDEGKCAMSVSYPSGTTVPAELNIEASDGSDLIINTPQSTVTLDGERTYNSVRASTASNTLIIDEDVTIGTLYLEKGNVLVYGEIMALNTDDLEEGETPTVYVYGNIQGQVDDDDVTVVIPASAIIISETEMEMNEGESAQLSASVVPANATSSIVWSTSNASVATVSESGMVTAVEVGECTIYATINGLEPATCSVTVISDDPAKQPFTITSTGSSTVTIEKNGSPSDISLEYKKGNAGWASYTIGTAIALCNGESLQLRAGEGGNASFSSESGKYQVSSTGTGTIKVSGNIMSLVDRTLKTTSVNENEFTSLFYQCHKLTDASQLILPAITLASSCYNSMFFGCTSLTTAPKLPATRLAYGCYQSMFSGCTSLTAAPSLPATSLADFCFAGMFEGCSSLTAAPSLPKTALATCCYARMFSGCTSLAVAPELPVNVLRDACYMSMFARCTSLVNAPKLPATRLAYGCYQSMFSGCTSLTTAPELPATILADNCYTYMFSGCTSLTTAPTLPATTLVNGCYTNMFSGCSKLNYVKALFVSEPSQSYTYNWLDGVAPSGTFIKSNDATWDITGSSGIPYGWTVENERDDIVDFKDANFKAYCVQNFDTDGDGRISFDEASVVKTINASSKSISSLVGIEKFTNLETLNCGCNPISEIDLSHNTVLQNLDCCACEVESLDISNCTELTNIAAYGNSQLSSIDVTGCAGLKALLFDGTISSVDLSHNTALAQLYALGNSLTSLDVSNNPALRELSCNNNKMATLDVSNNLALAYLECNMSTLETLYVAVGQTITGITVNRSSRYINDNTEIIHLGNYIHFEDSNVESVCVAKFDSNHDGVLTYEEAAAVSNSQMAGAFRNNKVIVSFNELQYFTGLTSLDGGYFDEDYYGVFYNCSNLRSVSLPESLSIISYEAFKGCSSLESIDIPAGVTKLNEDAFYYCSSLSTVTIRAMQPPHLDDDGVFASLPNNAILYVPNEALSLYQNSSDSEWRYTFSAILAIEE